MSPAQKKKEAEAKKPAMSRESLIAPVEEVSLFKRYKKEIILALILIFGAIALVGGYLYRVSQEEEQLPVTTPSFSIQQTNTLFLPVITNPDEYQNDAIRGKLVRSEITEDTLRSNSIELQQEEISRDLLEGEALWETPVEIRDQSGELNQSGTLLSSEAENYDFPIEIIWLVYNRDDVSSAAVALLQQNLEEVFILDTIQTMSLEQVSSSVYSMEVEMTYSLEEQVMLDMNIEHPLIQQAAEAAEEVEEEPDVSTILIQPTGVGFLNVRSGPGTEFEQITQVNPGEEYVFIEVVNDWYHILLEDDLDGWVISTYVEEQ